MPDQSASLTAQQLVDEMFARFGVPDKLHSDQGLATYPHRLTQATLITLNLKGCNARYQRVRFFHAVEPLQGYVVRTESEFFIITIILIYVLALGCTMFTLLKVI